MKTKASTLTPRMLSEFCEKRLAPVLPEEVVKRLHQYMGELLAQQEYPPYRGAGLDLTMDFKADGDQIGHEGVNAEMKSSEIEILEQ